MGRRASFFLFLFQTSCFGAWVLHCIMVRMKDIGTGLSLERKSSRDKIPNILCESMPLKPSLLPTKSCLLRVPPPTTICTMNWEPSIQHADRWETLIQTPCRASYGAVLLAVLPLVSKTAPDHRNSLVRIRRDSQNKPPIEC